MGTSDLSSSICSGYIYFIRTRIYYASNTQEENTDWDQANTGHNNSEGPHWSPSLPQQISDHSPEDNFTRQHTPADDNIFEEIPQLEEDWENDQFADANENLINRHNTHSESDRIQHEYTEQLLALSDNQYYSEQHPSIHLQYSIQHPDYYMPQPRRSQQHQCDPVGYYPPELDPADVQHWNTCGRGNHAFLHGHRLFGEKNHSVESRKARKR